MLLNWKKFSLTLALATPMAMAIAVTGHAQQYGDKDYQPHSGQEGKDVIWVPTPNELIAKMLDMAKLTAQDIHTIWAAAMAAR